MATRQQVVATPTELFIEAMTQLVSGVAVVTARRVEGEPCGLLVSSICSYSARPPSVLISIDQATRSYAALVKSNEFGVHLLGHSQDETARVFASRSSEKFARQSWRWDGTVPRLDGAAVYLRCATERVIRHGDHAIIIGTVCVGEISPDEPLIYYRRQFGWRLQE